MLLQWVHGLFAVGNRKANRQEGDALGVHQWVHGLFAVGNCRPAPPPSSRSRRFNGSTACSPRATEMTLEMRRQKRCFNGSTACSPWATGRAEVARPPRAELQWVHGLFAV